jgi:hypothetical protein
MGHDAIRKKEKSKTWWHTPIIPAPGRLREEDCKFEPVWAT